MLGGDGPEATSILEPLARFVAGVDYRRIPESVARQTVLAVVDTLGCVIYGYGSGIGQKAVAVEKALAGPAEATVLVGGERLPAMSAARVNGYLGDIHEFNDIVGGHASVGVVPAALAVAEWHRTSGADFLAAVAIGCEVAERVRNSVYKYMKPFTDCNTAMVGPPNTFATAAVAAKLMGLDDKAILAAMLISGTLAGACPAESMRAGGSAKPYMTGGWPAATGIYAAVCAREGLDGTASILDGEFGYLKTWGHKVDLRPFSQGLGERWALDNPRRKAHACCGYIHAPIDCLLGLIKRHAIRHEDIASMEVAISPYVISLIGGPPPGDPLTAKFSTRYCLAVAAMTNRAIGPADTDEPLFHQYLDAGAADLLQRIVVVGDDSFRHFAYARIRLTTRDGEEYSDLVKYARGAPENPMSEEELIEKFRRQAASAFSAEQVERILAATRALPAANDVSGLVDAATR